MKRVRSNQASGHARAAGLALAALPALLASVVSAFAADVKDTRPSGPRTPIVTMDCILTDHKGDTQTFNPPATVPDNDPAGVTFGPIVLADDHLFISHVVLRLDCSHSWIGDLIVRLLYDENGDGVIDTSATIICRPGRAISCGESGYDNGCGSNFVTGAIYSFEDTTANSLPQEACDPSFNIPGGCYRPTGFDTSPMEVFEGRRKGGKWWLFVSDNAAGDVLSLTSWSVYMLNAPVAVVPTCWGRPKLRYR